MTVTRVILVSDSHLSAAAPEAAANWEAVLGYVTTTPADLVVHLGDLTMDGTHAAADLREGRRQLGRLPVRWLAVPGNHDAGDNPGPGMPADWTVDAARRQPWLDTVGADHWSVTAGGWTLLGLNAQLIGSGLAAESAQWAWLEEQVRGLPAGRPFALVTHKPVTAGAAELAAAPRYRFWPPAGRDRLATLTGDRPPALVLSGHVHQQRMLRIDGTEHVWAPATWAVLPDEVQPPLGAKRCGVVSLELPDGAPPRPRFVEPDGIAQLTLTRDLPDPYRH